MKAEELMIGDWVLCDINAQSEYEFDNVNYQPFQIKTGEDIDYACERNMMCTDDVYIPIPITSEILEKNGFKKSDDDDFYMWENYNERIVWFEDGYTNVTSIKCDCIYDKKLLNVHELQHALKLCGINNEIEL